MMEVSITQVRAEAAKMTDWELAAAMKQCRDALRDDPQDGVASVRIAQYERERKLRKAGAAADIARDNGELMAVQTADEESSNPNEPEAEMSNEDLPMCQTKGCDRPAVKYGKNAGILCRSCAMKRACGSRAGSKPKTAMKTQRKTPATESLVPVGGRWPVMTINTQDLDAVHIVRLPQAVVVLDDTGERLASQAC